MAVVEPSTDGEWDQYTRLMSRSFGIPLDDAHARVAAQRPSALARFEVQDGIVLAGALALPCHQYFGGRPVTSAAMSGLCVAPQERGQGTGRRVAWALADTLGREGVAVSPSYATAIPFMRSMGWEIGGQSFAFATPAAGLSPEEPLGTVVRNPDREAVRALRTRMTAAWSGAIERPSWWWAWREPAPSHVCLGWHDGNELVGYLTYRADDASHGAEGWGTDVVVIDFLATTRDALDGLLRVLGAERSVSPTIRFDYGVLPPDTMVRNRIATTLAPVGVRDWMLRVLDPERALTEAGWPTITGRMEIEVAALGRAASIMTVDFSGGRATVSPAATARVRMATGAFAAWFAGALPATQAAMLGGASGPPEDLAFMDLLVADRRPWLPDIF